MIIYRIVISWPWIEEFKIVVVTETSPRESIPESHSSGEETVWAEQIPYQKEQDENVDDLQA